MIGYDSTAHYNLLAINLNETRRPDIEGHNLGTKSSTRSHSGIHKGPQNLTKGYRERQK